MSTRFPASATGAEVEILGHDALAAEPAAWDDLMARALSPHPHYSRHVMAAHRSAGLAPGDLGVVVVRRGGRLDAVMPFRLVPDICGLGRPVAKPFLSPFVTETTPLVAGDAALAETLDALTTGLGKASGGRSWRWPLLATESAVGGGLVAAMAAAGWMQATVGDFQRPILDRHGDYATFLAGHPHRSRYKDLHRRQRRLAERGLLTVDVVTTGPGMTGAVEEFLALEKSGWKGEAGTALACRPEHEAFARSLFAEGGGPVGVRADILRLYGRPLAISLALVVGRTAYLLKTAFDETARSSAPGLVLETEIVRAMHETAFCDRLDSATLAGSALERLYTQRLRIGEIVAVPSAGRRWVSLDHRVRLARFEHAAKARAKRLLGRR